MYRINWNSGIVNEGNQYRIRRVMRKAQMVGELTVGFIGGSITQGSLATEPHNCYAARVLEWWERKFPGCHFRYVNAGIGGTTSHFSLFSLFSTEYNVGNPDDRFNSVVTGCKSL